jgi:hypothetical protein
MTVYLATTIQRFQGLSTDDKPSTPAEGSTFHAVDTGEQYIFHNNMWEPDLRMAKALETALG